jgi:hypothetical protein
VFLDIRWSFPLNVVRLSREIIPREVPGAENEVHAWEVTTICALCFELFSVFFHQFTIQLHLENISGPDF